jgi:hypothetical protein
MRRTIIPSVFVFIVSNFTTGYFCVHDTWWLAVITVPIMAIPLVAMQYAASALEPTSALTPPERVRRVAIFVWTLRACALALCVLTVAIGPVVYGRTPPLSSIAVATCVFVFTLVATEWRLRRRLPA